MTGPGFDRLVPEDLDTDLGSAIGGLLERARACDDDDEVGRPPWRGVPWGEKTRARWVRAHRDAFRLG